MTDSLGDRMKGLGPCVEWDKARSSSGYGQKWSDGKVRYVHRLAWEESNGPIPKGMQILHRCDNPPCFRLDHLALGTSRDNAVDMATKGRQVFQRSPRKHPRGVRHHNAKVTPDVVREIRLSSMSQQELADKYGLAQSTVWAIRKRQTWREVA